MSEERVDLSEFVHLRRPFSDEQMVEMFRPELTELLALRTENTELQGEVKNWLCITCKTVYPGPPSQGVTCVICPKCGGTTGPANSMLVREQRAENERLRSHLHEAGATRIIYLAVAHRNRYRALTTPPEQEGT